ncbi:hypothetical protein LJR153_007231 [Paenibacillus sp. LjRoot153]|uniref:DNA sulfur modification protein DndB n=1 Tax=Paenibacillus sp. LjRoot153 TaxID=3342270 RepID=UPI003ED12F37
MNPVYSLSQLFSEQKETTFVEIPGMVSRAFGHDTLVTTLTMSKLFSIYEIDLEVQRAIVPQNLSKLMDYISLFLDNQQGIYFPGIVLSARGAGLYDKKSKTYNLQAIEKLYVVDGQHRIAAFKRLAELLQSSMASAKDQREYEKMEEISLKLGDLFNFPISVLIYLDIDAKQERQLFSDINKLPRKIGGNLAVLREQRRFYHVLATKLSQAPSISQISVDLFSERGRAPEYIMTYHLLIEILVGLFEGRMKSLARGNLYHFTEKDLDHHYSLALAYLEALMRVLPEPDRKHQCWTENIQISLAIFLHGQATKTGQFNRYALEHAVKILPHIEWDGIYSGDESSRLPRRTRIMKALQFFRDYYEENHINIHDLEAE